MKLFQWHWIYHTLVCLFVVYYFVQHITRTEWVSRTQNIGIRANSIEKCQFINSSITFLLDLNARYDRTVSFYFRVVVIYFRLNDICGKWRNFSKFSIWGWRNGNEQRKNVSKLFFIILKIAHTRKKKHAWSSRRILFTLFIELKWNIFPFHLATFQLNSNRVLFVFRLNLVLLVEYLFN